MVVAITAATAVVMVVAITVATVVAITAATAVVMVVAITVATAVVIPNLAKLLVRKAGKIEVMGTLLKTLNMKLGEVEEKEEFPMRIKYQTRRTNNLSLQV
jgi:hypothetical protein